MEAAASSPRRFKFRFSGEPSQIGHAVVRPLTPYPPPVESTGAEVGFLLQLFSRLVHGVSAFAIVSLLYLGFAFARRKRLHRPGLYHRSLRQQPFLLPWQFDFAPRQGGGGGGEFGICYGVNSLTYRYVTTPPEIRNIQLVKSVRQEGRLRQNVAPDDMDSISTRGYSV